MRAAPLLLAYLVVGCARGKPAVAAAPAAESNASAPSGGALPSDDPAPNGPAHDHTHTQGYDRDFSAVQAYAARFDSSARDAWQKPDEVVKLLALEPGQTVADVGAGTGYFLGALSEAVGPEGHVLGLDVEPNMVRYMRERAKSQGWLRVEAREVAPDDPGLETQSVDRILIVNTWHHISDRARYAGRLRDALREGGAVMVVDFTLESDHGPPAVHRLTPEQVVEELVAGGLDAEVVEETLPKQYVVVGRR